MPTYRLTATLLERYGAFHVTVVAASDDRAAGVIFREHMCDSRELATAAMEVMIEQVKEAVAAVGGVIEPLEGSPERR